MGEMPSSMSVPRLDARITRSQCNGSELSELTICSVSRAGSRSGRTPNSGICEQTRKTNSVTAVHVSFELNGTLRSGELVE